MSFIKEFWEFLKVRKKYWLLPIIIVLVLLTPLLMSCGTKGSLYIPEERYPQNDSFNKQDNNDLSNFSVT